MSNEIRETSPEADGLNIRLTPRGGSTNNAALVAELKGSAGKGSALLVRSDNSSAPSVRVQGAGELLDLRGSADSSVLSVSNAGNLSISGNLDAAGRALGIPQPSDSGYLAWSFDPCAIASNTNLVSGTVYLAAVFIHKAMSVTSLWFTANSVQGTLTSGQNWIGIYNSSGTKLVEASLDAVTTTGAKQVSVSSTALTPGLHWVSFLANASSGNFGLGCGVASGNVKAVVNGALAASVLRAATNGTSQTTLPSSITPANNQASTIPIWAGLS